MVMKSSIFISQFISRSDCCVWRIKENKHQIYGYIYVCIYAMRFVLEDYAKVGTHLIEWTIGKNQSNTCR